MKSYHWLWKSQPLENLEGYSYAKVLNVEEKKLVYEIITSDSIFSRKDVKLWLFHISLRIHVVIS